MYGFVVTTAGEGLLARAAGGETLTITGTRVGSGSVAGESAARALTALIQDQAAGTYSTPEVSGGQLSMVVEYRNNLNGGLQAGFTLREFGVFARVGDDAPTLMYYAALGDRAPEVPPITEGLDVHRWPVAVAVSGELAVTVEDPSGAFVDDSELQKYLPLAGGTMTGPLALDALQVGTKGKGVVVGLDSAGTLETPVVQVASQYGSGPAVLRGVAQAQQSGDALPKGQADGAYLPKSQKGQPDGVASLDGEGKVPGEQLPEMNYVQNITRTAAVAAGQSIQAGDVVSLNEAGQAMDPTTAHDGNQGLLLNDGSTEITESASCPAGAGETLVAFPHAADSGNAAHIFLYLVRKTENGTVSIEDNATVAFGSNDALENLGLAKISDNKFALTVGWTKQSSTKKVYLGLVRVSNGTITEPNETDLVETEMVYGVPVYLGGNILDIAGQKTVPIGADTMAHDAYDVSGDTPVQASGEALNGFGLVEYENAAVTLVDDTYAAAFCTSDGQIRAYSGDGLGITLHSGSGAWDVACCTGGDGHIYVGYTVRSGNTYTVYAAEIEAARGGPLNKYQLTQLASVTLGSIENVQGIFLANINGTVIAFYGGRFARALTHNTSGDLTGGNQYAFRSSAAANSSVSAAGSGGRGLIVAYAQNVSDLYATSLEVYGDRVAAWFEIGDAQAIALEDGGAGESIELLFSGTAELPGIAAGTRISGDSGVQGYAPVDGWLYATPYWASPQVILGSYAGTGTYGADSPNTLTFPFEPKLVLICPKNNWNMGIFARGIERVGATWQQGSGRTSIVTWNENGLEWYSNDGSSYQFNSEGTTYIYLAIG